MRGGSHPAYKFVKGAPPPLLDARANAALLFPAIGADLGILVLDWILVLFSAVYANKNITKKRSDHAIGRCRRLSFAWRVYIDHYWSSRLPLPRHMSRHAIIGVDLRFQWDARTFHGNVSSALAGSFVMLARSVEKMECMYMSYHRTFQKTWTRVRGRLDVLRSLEAKKGSYHNPKHLQFARDQFTDALNALRRLKMPKETAMVIRMYDIQAMLNTIVQEYKAVAVLENSAAHLESEYAKLREQCRRLKRTAKRHRAEAACLKKKRRVSDGFHQGDV